MTTITTITTITNPIIQRNVIQVNSNAAVIDGTHLCQTNLFTDISVYLIMAVL